MSRHANHPQAPRTGGPAPRRATRAGAGPVDARRGRARPGGYTGVATSAPRPRDRHHAPHRPAGAGRDHRLRRTVGRVPPRLRAGRGGGQQRALAPPPRRPRDGPRHAGRPADGHHHRRPRLGRRRRLGRVPPPARRRPLGPLRGRAQRLPRRPGDRGGPGPRPRGGGAPLPRRGAHRARLRRRRHPRPRQAARLRARPRPGHPVVVRRGLRRGPLGPRRRRGRPVHRGRGGARRRGGGRHRGRGPPAPRDPPGRAHPQGRARPRVPGLLVPAHPGAPAEGLPVPRPWRGRDAGPGRPGGVVRPVRGAGPRAPGGAGAGVRAGRGGPAAPQGDPDAAPPCGLRRRHRRCSAGAGSRPSPPTPARSPTASW